MSLLHFRTGHGVRMGLPLPEVRESYTQEERKAYGVPQEAQLRFPVVAGRW
jgi:hypothetical protein